jgi:predicted metalloprotease with PDZ domain
MLRQQSAGQKSIDDFARLFFGGESAAGHAAADDNAAPEVKPYTLEDVIHALNQVQPYDWRGFFRDRVQKISEPVPLNGIANSGWKLVYTGQQNAISRLVDQVGGAYNATATLGLVVNRDGALADVIKDGLGDRSGLAPGMKILAVNDRKFAPELLPAAVREAHKRHQPIRLLVENSEYIRPVTLEYFDGEQHPHLVRDESKPDLLGEILRPKVTKLPRPFVDSQ